MLLLLIFTRNFMDKRIGGYGFLLTLSLLLSACGGGGGSSAAAVTPLTSARIQAAAKSANSASFVLSVADSALDYGRLYLGAITVLTGTNTVLPSPIPAVCTAGTYTASWTVGNTATIMTGDTVTLNLSNCVKSDGLTYNGSETYTVSSTAVGNYNYSSNINNLRVTTSLSNISFSGSTLAYKYTLSAGNTYPKSYVTTGNINAILTTSAGNIASGNYNITGGNKSTTLSNASNNTWSTSLTANDGTNSYILSNTTPTASTYNAGVTTITTYPIYNIAYAGANIISTSYIGSTVLSGTNSDGSSIPNISLPVALF
jgi:hypothetical protein